MNVKLIFKLILTVMLSPLLNENSYAQQAAFYQFKVGQITVTALSDGTVPLDAEKLFAQETVKVKQLMAAAYLHNPVETSINTYLIKIADKLILIDSGSGELFGPSHGGRLVSSLAAAGYRAEQITDVLLTHIHNDHSGGLSINGQAVFPNAVIHVSQLDTDYWLDEERMNQADPKALSSNKSSFVNAIKVFKPYQLAGKVKTFVGDVELFPGIRAVATPGHTPGHCLFVLEDGADKLVFCGDLIHIAGIQFARPELIDGFDVDKNRAAEARIRIYKDAAEQGYLIAGDHISYPGVGRLKKLKHGYQWMPIPYSLEGRTR